MQQVDDIGNVVDVHRRRISLVERGSEKEVSNQLRGTMCWNGMGEDGHKMTGAIVKHILALWSCQRDTLTLGFVDGSIACM